MSTEHLDIVAEEAWGVAHAQQLYSQLNGALENQQNVRIDASAVERVGTSILQTLYAFSREVGSDKSRLQWTGRSEAFDNAVTLLGMDSQFGFEK
jgi:anti-anti-sigma regulatory factor